MSVKLKDLLETSDEITEQIVKKFHPKADIYKEDEEGVLRIKKQYREMNGQILTILNNNLNGGKKYELQK